MKMKPVIASTRRERLRIDSVPGEAGLNRDSLCARSTSRFIAQTPRCGEPQGPTIRFKETSITRMRTPRSYDTRRPIAGSDTQAAVHLGGPVARWYVQLVGRDEPQLLAVVAFIAVFPPTTGARSPSPAAAGNPAAAAADRPPLSRSCA